MKKGVLNPDEPLIYLGIMFIAAIIFGLFYLLAQSVEDVTGDETVAEQLAMRDGHLVLQAFLRTPLGDGTFQDALPVLMSDACRNSLRGGVGTPDPLCKEFKERATWYFSTVCTEKFAFFVSGKGIVRIAPQWTGSIQAPPLAAGSPGFTDADIISTYDGQVWVGEQAVPIDDAILTLKLYCPEKWGVKHV